MQLTILYVDDNYVISKGGLAQLAERLLCMQKVTGSIPVTSIGFCFFLNLNVSEIIVQLRSLMCRILQKMSSGGQINTEACNYDNTKPQIDHLSVPMLQPLLVQSHTIIDMFL